MVNARLASKIEDKISELIFDGFAEKNQIIQQVAKEFRVNLREVERLYHGVVMDLKRDMLDNDL